MDILTIPQTIQKGSPFLEEVNQLIDLANQMGLIEGLFAQTVHNRTKCDTWNEIHDSHMEGREKVVIGFNAIHGLMILLVVGLSVALLIFMMEHMAYWTVKEQLVNRNISCKGTFLTLFYRKEGLV